MAKWVCRKCLLFLSKIWFFFWGKCSRPTFYAIEVISLLCIVNIICIVIIFFVYLFSLIKILQTNAGGGSQNVDKNTDDDFEEENDSHKEENDSKKEDTDSYDDWSSNIYVFKFGEGYYSFHVLMNIWFYFIDLFNCTMHFLVLDNYGFVLVIWIEKLLGDLCFLAIKILEMISLLLSTELICCK